MRYILEFRMGWPLKSRDCSTMSGLLSSYDGYIRNLNSVWQDSMEDFRSEAWNRVHFLVLTMILGFLTIFKKCQASSTFEALNYASLSTCQRDVRPLVQMRWRPTAFCRVSTGIQTSFHLAIWKTSLHLSLCSEIRASFGSGNLIVHFTWSRKHRVLLT